MKDIQIRLPADMGTLFRDIKAERTKKFERTTNISIVIDAVKAYHEALCHDRATQSQGM